MWKSSAAPARCCRSYRRWIRPATSPSARTEGVRASRPRRSGVSPDRVADGRDGRQVRARRPHSDYRTTRRRAADVTLIVTAADVDAEKFTVPAYAAVTACGPGARYSDGSNVAVPPLSGSAA